MPKSCKWLIGVRICPHLVNDWSKSGYVQILQTIDQSLVMPKSYKWLIGVLIWQCLANDWLESGYAKVLKMIEQLESGLCKIWKLWKYPEAKWTKVRLEQRLCLEFQVESSSVMIWQCLANDWLESGYAKDLKMIEQLESGLCRIWKLWKYPEAKWTKVWLEQRLCLESQFKSSSVMFAFSNCSVRRTKWLETIKNTFKAG